MIHITRQDHPGEGLGAVRAFGPNPDLVVAGARAIGRVRAHPIGTVRPQSASCPPELIIKWKADEGSTKLMKAWRRSAMRRRESATGAGRLSQPFHATPSRWSQ